MENEFGNVRMRLGKYRDEYGVSLVFGFAVKLQKSKLTTVVLIFSVLQKGK